MTKRSIPNIKQYIKKYKKRSVRQRVLIAVAALVVFCTTYAMILPAITMEGKVNCGKEEHIHQNSCYTTEKLLVCELEEGKSHLHEENCYNSNGDLICKADTSVLHTHTDECYTTKMVMACQKIMHEHTASCIESVNQATEKVTAGLTSEAITESSTESKEISKTGSNAVVESSTSEAKDFKAYLEEQIVIDGMSTIRGEVSHSVYDVSDPSNPILVPDTTLVSGEDYLFSLYIKSIAIEPGVYKYTLPANIYLVNDAENGQIQNGVAEEVGKYSAVRESNIVITLEFGEEMNYVSDFSGYIKFNIRIDNGGEPPTEEVIEEPAEPNVEKTGAFNEADGKFDFTISATIPSCGENGKFKDWHLYDRSEVNYSWYQNLSEAEIEIAYGGETSKKLRNITELKETDNDSIAYLIANDRSNSLYLVNRCKCDKNRCDNLTGNRCKSLEEQFGSAYSDSKYSDWCTCWNLPQNATLTITYKNDKNIADIEVNEDDEVIDNYLLNKYPGELYLNEVRLLNKNKIVSRNDIELEIPKLISKEVSDSPNSSNSYVTGFKIIVNESKKDLSKVDADNDGKPDGKILIQDAMKNVAYIPDSIEILVEDSGTPLVYGEDYEIEYIPGSEDTSKTYTATLNITLNNPQAYTYIITYDGQAINDPELEDPNFDSEIANTATLKFYSYPSFEASEYCHFEDGWSYARRSLKIEKIEKKENDDDPTKYLPGAVFGLFSENGYKIAEGVTASDGTYIFETNIRKGIIFQEDKAYYIQELEAPAGYTKDETQNWFYFAEKNSAGIKVDFEIMRCTLDDNGSSSKDNPSMVLENEKGLTLPETGGCGTVIYTIAGLILVCGSAYVLYKKYLYWEGVLK